MSRLVSHLDSPAVKWGAKLLVAGLLLWSALRRVDLVQVWELAQHFEPTYLVPILGSLVVVLFLRALRWQLLVSAETPISFRSAYVTYGLGAVAMSVWPGVGELSRAAMLRAQNGISLFFGMGVLALEKLVDLGFLLGVLGWAFVRATVPQSKLWAWSALLFGPALIWFSSQVRRVRWCPASVKPEVSWLARQVLSLKSKRFVRNFAIGLLLLIRIDRRQRCRLLLVSLLIWVFNYLIYFSILGAYGIQSAWHAAGVFMAASFVGLSVAVAPAGLGTLQWAVIAALAVVGVDADLATVLSFTVQSLLLPATVVWGLPGLWWGRFPPGHGLGG